MKCGTSALHLYLDQHPDICMSRPKELNFFLDEEERTDMPRRDADRANGGVSRLSGPGNWHRGVGWYASHFRGDASVRGESSPGYTSPSYPSTASRMAGIVPDARLVYMVRDPVERAVSQYRHHRGDGSETRPPEQALLDPKSQYVARGRYAERLRPFLASFGREQIAIVSCEDLRAEPEATLRSLFGFLGVDASFHTGEHAPEPNGLARAVAQLDRGVKERLAEAFAPDAQRLRAIAGRSFAGWTV